MVNEMNNLELIKQKYFTKQHAYIRKKTNKTQVIQIVRSLQLTLQILILNMDGKSYLVNVSISLLTKILILILELQDITIYLALKEHGMEAGRKHQQLFVEKLQKLLRMMILK